MGIISKVGRKKAKTRLLIAAMYVVLGLGAVTMIYPFLIMLTSSLSNRFDYSDFSVLPRYVNDESRQLKKYLFHKYAPADFSYLAANYAAPWNSFQNVKHDDRLGETYYPSPTDWADPDRALACTRRVMDWYAYIREQDPAEMPLVFFPELADRFPAFLRDRYVAEARRQAAPEVLSQSEATDRALVILRDRYADYVPRFEQITLVPESFFSLPNWAPTAHAKFQDWVAFKRTLDPRYFNVISARWLWQKEVLRLYGTVDAANEVWGTTFKAVGELRVPLEPPTNPAMAADWEGFINRRVPRRLLSFDPAPYRDAWRQHLREAYGTIERFNRKHMATFASLEAIPLSGQLPANERLRAAWSEFQAQHVPATAKRVRCPEVDFPRFLRRRYGGLHALGEAYAQAYTAFDQVELPYAMADFVDFQAHRASLVWDFLTMNYRRVFGFIAVKGRALWNTAVLVVLSVLSALTVNPLAAYALSRFRMRRAHYILIFMLATMAFPAEVTMIPGFLLLRDLGLLNTFAALVLPGMANGFSVFLLKGFFDSLPRELYEAAAIDGASEMTIFARITMPLSKPILAYIALQAFVAAYGGFMWAFLVCQDADMWTIMVFLYQFQWQHAREPWLAMTSLVVAAVPTLIVFTFCQRVIMRGIVIPSMK